MRTSTIFKSRWWALVWSAGIIWFALDYAGSKPATNTAATNQSALTDDSGQPVSDDDVKTAADALGLN